MPADPVEIVLGILAIAARAEPAVEALVRGLLEGEPAVIVRVSTILPSVSETRKALEHLETVPPTAPEG